MEIIQSTLQSFSGILEVDMGNIQANNWQVPGNVSSYIDVESRLLQLESNQSNSKFELQLLNGRITTLESNVDTYPTAVFIAQIDDNLMYINATMETQADTILTLNNTIGQLHSVIYIQNISIIDNKEKLDQLDSDVTDAQKSIQTQMSVIQQLADNHIAANASVHDHNSRIDALESEIAIDRAMVSNHSNIIELLEENLVDQNTSIQMVNEKLSKLNFSSEQNRAIVTELELKSRVSNLEENVTNEAIILRNITSRLNEIDLNMTIVNEMMQTQHDKVEQLIVNLTAYRIDGYAFSTRLSDLEAKTNSSETSFADHVDRIGQIEAMQLSDILLNEEQKTQLIELGEEINKTWNAVQDLIGTPGNETTFNMKSAKANMYNFDEKGWLEIDNIYCQLYPYYVSKYKAEAIMYNYEGV